MKKEIYTLGSSNRSWVEFSQILQFYNIEVLIDVRRFPTSHFGWFCRENLSLRLKTQTINYLWMGEELGGYRTGGYEKFTKSKEFLRGLEKLKKLASTRNVLIMCAERFPWKCHRAYIAQSLEKQGWRAIHILERGKVWESKKEKREISPKCEKVKKNLFMGIDLGGWERKTTGICVLKTRQQKNKLELFPYKNHCKSCSVAAGSETFKKIKYYLPKTSVIAIDGPLTFGKGKGKMRLYEKFLSTKIFRQEHVSPLPPSLMSQVTEVGMGLVSEITSFGFVLNQNIIEVFPTITLALLKSVENLVLKIAKECQIKIEIPPCLIKNSSRKLTHQKSAFICSLLAFLHSQNLTNFIGYKDGLLYLPSPLFWTEDWQEKFSLAWQEKDRLKYKFLRTDIPLVK
jgi:predicted nuclease with RNAse H fold